MNDLLQLMHDTMSPVNRIKGLVALLKTHDKTQEETDKILLYIEKSANDLNLVLDAFYIKQKDQTPKA